MRRTPTHRPDAQGPAVNVKEAARALENGRSDGNGKEKKEKEGHRETVEAIVVAMILALLVRGFEAEAFVIPTGSMAPTLMGRHKEVTCPQCGFVYAVNASDEDDGRGARFRSGPKNRFVVGGTCVNCRYTANIAEAPAFNGDRILVMKFPYDMPNLPGSSGPRRWDVVVFRYPEEPEVSYIKRLIGLPGEELRVSFGDIYIKPPGAKEFRLERKPLRHQDAMQVVVYDDAHRPAALKDQAAWRRWAPSAEGAWTEEAPGRYVAAAATGREAVLRYRHLAPDPEQWQAILDGSPLPRAPRPTLVTDYYAYNTNVTASLLDLPAWFGAVDRDRDGVISRSEFDDGYHRDVLSDGKNWSLDFDDLDLDRDGAVTLRELSRRDGKLMIRPHDADDVLIQPHWVGDLTVSGTLDVTAPGGTVRFELVEGGVVNRCAIDLATGVATLSHGDRELGHQATPIRGTGTYAFRFANVDDRLTLVVDGRPVFGDGLTYEDEGRHPAPTAADLAPVAVASQGASVAVSGLVLKRDIYYTQNPGRSDYGAALEERYPRTVVELFDLLSDPSRFPALGNLGSQDFPIGPDRYMMFGDNSPRSKDGRGWTRLDAAWDPSERQSWEVPRALLTGKAFFIYWPHGKPFGPDIHVNDDIRIPFRPYVERMRWIR